MTSPEALAAHITALVTAKRAVLFMKGTRLSPSCGFSAQVVNTLDRYLDDYATVDVVADAAVREAMRARSDWPTFPQLYVDGVFRGGAEIVAAMDASGELAALLGAAPRAPRPPTLHIDPAAAEAIRAVGRTLEGAVVRMEISAGFHHELYFGDAQPDDVVADGGGVFVHMDLATSRRAEGLRIAHVTGSAGSGFRLENPNEPARVKPLDPADWRALHAGGQAPRLVDVRTPEERAIAFIAGDEGLLDPALEHALLALDRGTALAFYCHHGVRSLAAAEHFREKGFRAVYNLTGGIDAWSREVDPRVPRY
jgi:monothiol glutaredoxin